MSATAPRAQGAGPHAGRAEPTGPGADFGAFRHLRHGAYRRYARARIGDTARADAAVHATFAVLAETWHRTLSGPNPDHDAWQLLTTAVAAWTDTTDEHHPRRGVLHRTLPPSRADALVLHYRLGMTLTSAADLMGTDTSHVALELVLAERALPAAVVADLERADTRT